MIETAIDVFEKVRGHERSEQLRAAREADLLPYFRVLESAAGPVVEMEGAERIMLGHSQVAIAGGTAVINQKLLEALIGEAAVADIIRAAERDLRRTLRSALEGDARRFLDLLAPAGDGPEALRAAADRVLAEAERLIASLAETAR